MPLFRLFATLALVSAISACSTHAEKTLKVVVETEQGRGSASGSNVGDGYVLTNKHVCDKVGLEGAATVVIDLDGKRRKVMGFIASKNPDVDLCLLIADVRDLPVMRLATFPAQAGDLIQIVGYPAGHYELLQARVLGSAIQTIGNPFLGPVSVQFLTVVAAPIWGGSSGSAVTNESGRLVGVINAGGGPLSLFVPLEIVREFLRDAAPSLDY